jgi:hypothetical protein
LNLERTVVIGYFSFVAGSNRKKGGAKYLMLQLLFLKLRALAPAGTTDIAES